MQVYFFILGPVDLTISGLTKLSWFDRKRIFHANFYQLAVGLALCCIKFLDKDYKNVLVSSKELCIS